MPSDCITVAQWLSVLMGRINPVVLSTDDSDWNVKSMIACSTLISGLGLRGLVLAPPDLASRLKDCRKFGMVGRVLLKRGIVPFLLEQQAALNPEIVEISLSLTSVLSSLSYSRDGRVLLLHSAEIGSSLPGIDVLHHLLLHSNARVVCEALGVCNLLISVNNKYSCMRCVHIY